jgi:hypothetical protein
MDIARIPLDVGTTPERSYEQYEAETPTSHSEAVKASFDLALPDTAVGLIARQLSVNEFNKSGSAPLDPEEANARYPGMRTPFREPVNPYVAQMLADREQEQNQLQQKIARGPQDAWTKTKQFGAGLMAHAMDPVEFGAGALSGWAIGGLAARGAFGARAAIATDMVAAGARVSTATRLAVNVGEGVIGAGIENAAQEIAQASVEGAEGFDSGRTTSDVLTDWAIGTFAAGALQTGIKEASWHLGGTKRALRSTSPEADLAVARNVVQSIETDIRPDSTPIMKALAQETSVLPQDFGHAEYKFQPVDGKTYRERKFYAATTDANPDLKLGAKADLGDDFGFGRHLSDNPGVANAASARSMADSVGLVHEVEIKGELNPLPIGSSIDADPELGASLREILGHAGAEELAEGATIKDALGFIRNAVDEDILAADTLQQVEGIIKDRGYNALLDDGTKRLGQDHNPHNHLTILDDELIEGRQALQPDSRVVKAPDQAELGRTIEKSQDPNSKFFISTDEMKKNVQAIEEFRASAREDLNKLSSTIDETMLEIDDLQKQGLYTELEAQSLKESTVAARQMAEDQQTLLKAFKACAGA